MISRLPPDIAEALTPLFEALPLRSAMPALVPKDAQAVNLQMLAQQAVEAPAIAGKLAIIGGIWLYIDNLDKAHIAVQDLHSPTGSYWHAIMHRREGDFSNSKYWLRMTGSHPVMSAVPGYDAMAFVDQVQRSHWHSPVELLSIQRQEWRALFLHSVKEATKSAQS